MPSHYTKESLANAFFNGEMGYNDVLAKLGQILLEANPSLGEIHSFGEARRIVDGWMDTLERTGQPGPTPDPGPDPYPPPEPPRPRPPDTPDIPGNPSYGDVRAIQSDWMSDLLDDRGAFDEISRLFFSQNGDYYKSKREAQELLDSWKRARGYIPPEEPIATDTPLPGEGTDVPFSGSEELSARDQNIADLLSDPKLFRALWEKSQGIPAAGRSRYEKWLASRWQVPATNYLMGQNVAGGDLGGTFQSYLDARGDQPVGRVNPEHLAAITRLPDTEQRALLDLLESEQISPGLDIGYNLLTGGLQGQGVPGFLAEALSQQALSGPSQRAYAVSPTGPDGEIGLEQDTFLAYLAEKFGIVDRFGALAPTNKFRMPE
jgi:hypothetical protein